MAEKPLGTNHLPADLPTDWVNSQTITADGTEIGLDTQYGYNYLNTQINNAQDSINSINDAFVDLATSDYVDSQIELITGLDEATLNHVSDTDVHVNTSDKAKWNTIGIVSNLNTDIKTDVVAAINEINNKASATVVTSYGYHPTAVYSTSDTSPYVISTASISAVPIPNTAINIENPWGDAPRIIQITASLQTATYNTSSTRYTSGAAIYLIPSLTWSTTIPLAKAGTSISTTKNALASAVLRLEDTSSSSYPVSLWYKKVYDADYAVILGWNMIVVQTKV